MANAMIHWNGHQMCAIDTETTGLEAGYHEIIQICILPLDSEIRPRKDILPFYIEMIPDHPDRADPKAMSVNKLSFNKIARTGHCRFAAIDLLQDWMQKLGLPTTKFGNRKKILPLGQNYPFDMGHMKCWLGDSLYNDLFHYEYRDTKVAANYINDLAAMHAEPAPFPQISLSYLCSKLKIQNLKKHDALGDCVATAEVYRALIKRGLLA